jgi:hypothetical protein
MASTFSTTLRLELIGDGDQSGIWGQTTNTNLGTLLEQAITGVVDITMADANYTLSNFNGVSDESRNAVLVVGGTNAAVRDVIAPLVEKLYVVKNSTVGGFAINIRAASGSSVSVPSGATIWVYCDGTNFNAINTESVGNFEVNGNLTVTGNTNAVAATYTGNVVALNYSTAGNVTATNFIGSGLTITAINASNISAGTIANARTTAASANGASTIVARDSNGSFAGNVVTATTGTFTSVSGNGVALTAINASNISSGTIANARTTGSASNGASTIVLRDSNGSFAGNVITGTTGTFTSVSGNGVALTAINASNISSGTVATARLGSGTANASTFLRGDQTYAVPAASIAITNDTTTNASFFPTMTTATSGNVSTQTVSSTRLNFNPSSGLLTTYGGFKAASTGPFFMNDNTVTVNYTVPANVNAGSYGPITIVDGITVTVDTDANWIIV